MATGVPHLYFDVALHGDLRRWVKQDNSNTIDLEVCVCNVREHELFCLQTSILVGSLGVLVLQETPLMGQQAKAGVVCQKRKDSSDWE